MINHHGKVNSSFNLANAFLTWTILKRKPFNQKSIAVKPFLMKTVSESQLIDNGDSQNGGDDDEHNDDEHDDDEHDDDEHDDDEHDDDDGGERQFFDDGPSQKRWYILSIVINIIITRRSVSLRPAEGLGSS